MQSTLSTRLMILALGFALMGFTAQRARADIREVGRDLAENFGDAVISAEIVVSMGDDTAGSEQRIEAVGTVIGPDGLTVFSLSAIDPESLMSSMGPAMGMLGNSQTREKDIKLRIGRRTEISAAVVLRDRDLNMAFVRPIEKPEEPMTYLDLSQAADAQMLDQIVILSRMGKAANREIGLATGEIQTIIERPRKFFVPKHHLNGLGVPVFNEEGGLLGISLIRTTRGGFEGIMGGAMTLNGSQMLGGILPIILPASDVLEIAATAPEEAAPEEEIGADPTPGAVDQFRTPDEPHEEEGEIEPAE